jgi:C4-dicarboxylate-specific signal transduction histidine kinase
VKSVVGDALTLCQQRFSNSSIPITYEQANDSIEITCQPFQIVQVLINLLNNAFDGVSELKEKWIKINVGQTQEFIEICITDSGGGISPQTQERIFDPFFTTKDIGKGTGLGLSISKAIITHHKGNLFVDSQAKNTRFVIQLPIK